VNLPKLTRVVARPLLDWHLSAGKPLKLPLQEPNLGVPATSVPAPMLFPNTNAPASRLLRDLPA